MRFAATKRMTKTLSIVLAAVASGAAVWYYRSQRYGAQLGTADRGEVIYRNTPLAETGE
jgi:hypothetical protein